MKKTFIALFAAAVSASAATALENQELLDSRVDSINAMRGVQIGGSIRAVVQKSSFDTDQDKKAVNRMPDVEDNSFVSADIDFHFRPWEQVRANIMLRLEGGMQEYFSSASKMLSVGWLNVEGNIGNKFYWVVGDFRQQYTPLTLFAPSVDIMYEPTIFARKRHMAEKQQLLEGNQRNLQGINLQFRNDFGAAAGEFRAEALIARLARTSVLDLTGAEGNILPDDSLPGSTQASNTAKWLLSANLELFPISKNLYVGVTPMVILDNEDSRTYTYRHPDYNLDEDYEMQNINPYDTTAQSTIVISGRAGVDFAGFLGSKSIIMDVVGEYAFSRDDQDGEAVNGSALLAVLNAGYKADDKYMAVVEVDFLMNDTNWFNNVAQSPQFFAQRILNTDKDGYTIKYTVNSPLYSTFDALYNFTPKYSPASFTLGTKDADIQRGDSKSYDLAPFSKNSWTTNVYSKAQMALVAALSDPAIQLALPNGLATSNRLGARALLTAGLSNYVEAQGLFTMLSQPSPLEGFSDVSYMEYGGGLKWSASNMFGFKRNLELMGSYKHSERTMDLDAAVMGTSGSAELKSNFINAGFSAQYLPRLGVTAGFQYITTEYNPQEASMGAAIASALGALSAPKTKGTEMQWMVGLDYSLEENAWFSINYGIASVKNEYDVSSVTSDNAKRSATTGAFEPVVANLPLYYSPSVNADGVKTDTKYTHEFSRSIIEASINVEF